MHELLTPSQMTLADSSAIRDGTPGIELMENAGAAVVEVLEEHFPNAQNILVVCGTGNNGGDGFVAARRLFDKGKSVSVFICGDTTRVSGDAKLALARLDKDVLSQQDPEYSAFDIVIDALFGAGLDREVEGRFASTIAGITESERPVIAVDLPSGIDGKTGRILGCAVRASHTVTFFRKKPGHLLMPGRELCGECHLHQIGIDESVLKDLGFVAVENCPEIWQARYPMPSIGGHKYNRGHTLVVSGPASSTGAARLAAHAALRAGSGLVTLASPKDALTINASQMLSVMLDQADSPKDIERLLEDQRMNSIAIGPGMPPDGHTRKMVLSVLKSGRRVVLDAGALSAFSDNPVMLFDAIGALNRDVFLTPHEGEFARLFSDETCLPSKTEMAKRASERSNSTIILKGADTVVATPDGKMSISANAPPWLATAGSGDVLTGLAAGLAAQDMPAFEAANAAVWLHGDAATRQGPGMISSDLDEGLHQAIKHLVLSRPG